MPAARRHHGVKPLDDARFGGTMPIFDQQCLCAQVRPWRQRGRARALALCLSLLGAVFAVSARPAAAQAPSIDVAAEIKAVAAVMSPLRIKVSGGRIPSQAILMVRGVPASVMLYQGRSFSPGVWTVPLASIGALEIVPATAATGQSALTFELTTLDGQILASAHSTLIVTAAVAASGAPKETARGDTLALTAGPLRGNTDVTGAVRDDTSTHAALTTKLTPEDADRARMIMAKGDEAMEYGKITVARLLYHSAAEKGWAPAALALGATYDSRELQRSKVVGGVQPNAALARTWYEKAMELGSPEAERRLSQLSGR